MLRAFIAIQLSAELKRQIAQLQAQLKREALEPPGMGWVRPEAIHLTLKFLGETEEALVPKLRSVLEAAVCSVRPFTLQARGLGAFPTARRPHVLWIGLHGDPHAVEALGKMQSEVEQGAAELGFAVEHRTFSPHLTLARVKDRRAGPACEKMLSSREHVAVGIIEVRSVELIRSELNPKGSIYTTLVEVPLSDGV